MKAWIMAVALWGLLGTVQAATLYRWVSPTGVVTYQNTPPPPTVGRVKVMHLGAPSSPRVVRRAASAMQPVTLYEAPHCVPCRQARSYLRHRKIPYKRINVAASQAALKAMKGTTGSTTVPTFTVGKHVLVGYVPAVLASELTVAGYPHAPQ